MSEDNELICEGKYDSIYDSVCHKKVLHVLPPSDINSLFAIYRDTDCVS